MLALALTVALDSLTLIESELKLAVAVIDASAFTVLEPTVVITDAPIINEPDVLTLTESEVTEHTDVTIAEEGDTSAVEYFALLYFH